MMENKHKGLLLVLVTAVISGFSIFVNSFGVKGFDPSVFTFSKNILVAIFLAASLIGIGQFSKLQALTKRQWTKLAAIGLVGGSIPFILFFKGLQMTTGTTSAFLHKTLFIFVAVLALTFLKEKLTKGFLIGAAMLMIGNYLLLRPSLNFSAGHLMILGATFLWAIENTLSKHAVKELSGTTVAFGRMFFGSLFISIFLLMTGKAGFITTMSFNQYLWIILTSIFLLAYVSTFYNGIKHIKISTAACILSLGSPITTALAWVFKGIPVTLHASAGITCIVLGIASVLWFTYILSFVKSIFGAHHGWD